MHIVLYFMKFRRHRQASRRKKRIATSTIRRATMRFAIGGSRSTRPSGNTNETRLVSVPNPDPDSVTSFATTIASPFSWHLRAASRTGSPVSAANPIFTRTPRTDFKTSGFLTSFRSGFMSAFLSLLFAQTAGLQSATAAVATRTSAPFAAFAVSRIMSRALTTSTRTTPFGVARDTGPATSTTSCPRLAASSATANPIFPVDGFDKNLTGSRCSLVGPAVTANFILRHRPRASYFNILP